MKMITRRVKMKKNNIFFIMLFFCFTVSMFPLTFFTKIIDGDRKINMEEQLLINNILDEYYKCLTEQVFSNVEEFFHEKKVQISIEYNDTFTKYDSGKEYMGIITNSFTFDSIYHNFSKYAGNFETMKIESVIFSKQPYDYPIGNVFYLVLETKYKKFKTKEIMFISKDSGKIFEHIIYIPTSPNK